jgi:uncharacterized protein
MPAADAGPTADKGGDVSSRSSTTDPGQEAAHSGTSALLASAKYLLLTTFTQDGAPVATAVRVVVEGDRAVFRTSAASGTAKRLQHTDRVRVARCTALGLYSYEPTVSATARPLAGEEAGRAAQELGREYPAWRGFLTSPAHWALGRQAAYYELRAREAAAGPAAPATGAAHAREQVRARPIPAGDAPLSAH